MILFKFRFIKEKLPFFRESFTNLLSLWQKCHILTLHLLVTVTYLFLKSNRTLHHIPLTSMLFNSIVDEPHLHWGQSNGASLAAVAQ